MAEMTAGALRETQEGDRPQYGHDASSDGDEGKGGQSDVSQQQTSQDRDQQSGDRGQVDDFRGYRTGKRAGKGIAGYQKCPGMTSADVGK
jgi:hypothetical protein